MNIFKRIKAFIESLNYKARFEAFEKEVQQIKLRHAAELLELKSKIGDPRYVVERVFGRGVKYYDPATLSDQSKKNYYQQAQNILNSQVFINTFNMIIATQCQEQARQYNPQFPTQVARDVQMTINALELFKEALEEIPDPDKNPKKTTNAVDFNPYAGV